MSKYWLSFCDVMMPEGRQFLGVAIVWGQTLEHAIRRAHILGCNPGGTVMAHPIGGKLEHMLGRKWFDKLLSREELEEMDRELAAKLGTGPGLVTLEELERRKLS
jgi:hypothetical protein